MSGLNKRMKYILYISGMIIIFLLCFGFITVFAEPQGTLPVDTTVPTQVAVTTETVGISAPVVTTETKTAIVTPGTIVPPTTSQPITPTQTTAIPITDSPQTPVVTANTPSPITTTVSNNTIRTTTSPKTPSPTVTPQTASPVVTTENPAPVTAEPVDPSLLLPVYNPDIKSKSSVYNTSLEADLNGYVFYIAAPWDEYLDKNLNTAKITEFENKYNCKVVFLNLTRETIYEGLLISAATGKTYFDAVLIDAQTILVNYQPLGLLEDFSKYLTQEEIDSISKSYKKILGQDDKLYGIPAHAPDFNGIWVNQSIINKYKILDPLKYYQNNLWGMNDFGEIAADATGDKGAEQQGYDVYGISTGLNFYSPMLESTGGSIFRWTGKEFVSGVINKGTLSSLEFVKKLYNSYCIASNYETHFYKRTAALLAGESTMYNDIIRYLSADKSGIVFLPYPSAATGSTKTAVASYADSAAIVKSSRYPAHMAELLKNIYGGEEFTKRVQVFKADNFSAGKDKAGNAIVNSQIAKVYDEMLGNFTIDYTNTFDKEGIIDKNILSLLKKGTFNEATAQSEIVPIVDRLIKERNKAVNIKNVPVRIEW